MRNDIPFDCEPCLCCDGFGYIVIGLDSSGRDEPPTERTVVCESCNGEGMFASEPEEDFDEDHDCLSEPGDIDDGDMESAFASAGFGTDEDYGSASDIDFD